MQAELEERQTVLRTYSAFALLGDAASKDGKFSS